MRIADIAKESYGGMCGVFPQHTTEEITSHWCGLTILFSAAHTFDVKPMPRLAHGRRAKRDIEYFSNRDNLAHLFSCRRGIYSNRALNSPLVTSKCGVGIQIHISNNRRSDIDNYAKTVLDALEHGKIIANDHLVDFLSISVLRGQEIGRVSVTIYGLPLQFAKPVAASSPSLRRRSKAA